MKTTVDDAADALMNGMARLVDTMAPYDEGPAKTALHRAWLGLEKQVLDLLPLCELTRLLENPDAYLSGSIQIIDAFPSVSAPRPKFYGGSLTAIQAHLPAEAYAKTIEKGVVEARNVRRIFLHREGCANWTQYICERLSPASLFTGNHGQLFWHQTELRGLTDIHRIASAWRAQVRDHRAQMDKNLSSLLFSGMSGDLTMVGAYLAGARPTADMPESCTVPGKHLQSLMASHHGAIEISRHYGTLEDVISQLCNLEPSALPV
jgi:hypothetical protein